MSLRDRLESRLALCRIAVGTAQRAIRRAEKEADKDKRPVPRLIMDHLVAEVNSAKDECLSVEASLAGVSKFPPLTKGVY